MTYDVISVVKLKIATDAPLDMKIKSNCIADFFNLMGVEAIDPMASRKADPKLRAHPFARNSANKNSSNKNEPSAPGLSPEDVRLVKWVKDQHSRRGGFVRIFPRAETWSAYGGLLDYKTHTNELLAMRLFPDTYRACTAVVRSKLTEDKLIQQNGEISQRSLQYERRLLSISQRRKERSKMRRRKTNRAKKRIEVTSDLEDDAEAEEEEVEKAYETEKPVEKVEKIEEKSKKVEKIEPKEPEAPDYIKNSEIYQSIKSSKGEFIN